MTEIQIFIAVKMFHYIYIYIYNTYKIHKCGPELLQFSSKSDCFRYFVPTKHETNLSW